MEEPTKELEGEIQTLDMAKRKAQQQVIIGSFFLVLASIVAIFLGVSTMDLTKRNQAAQINLEKTEQQQKAAEETLQQTQNKLRELNVKQAQSEKAAQFAQKDAEKANKEAALAKKLSAQVTRQAKAEEFRAQQKTGLAETLTKLATLELGIINAQVSFDKGDQLVVLLEGLRIGVQLKQLTKTSSSLDSPQVKITTTLRQIVYEIRERNRFTGHQNYVLAVSFSPDGKTLASGSADNTLKLWNVADGKEIRTLRGHKDSVLAVSFSPDGKTLASGSSDATLKLWNVADDKEIRTFTGYQDSVQAVSFSPDGKTLASGSADNTIKLWDSDLWTLDLDGLLVKGCDWIRPYLQNNPTVSEKDRHLCDGVVS